MVKIYSPLSSSREHIICLNIVSLSYIHERTKVTLTCLDSYFKLIGICMRYNIQMHRWHLSSVKTKQPQSMELV